MALADTTSANYDIDWSNLDSMEMSHVFSDQHVMNVHYAATSLCGR